MDCNVVMEKMVEASIRKGLKEICFTDHIEFYIDAKEREPAIFDPQDYLVEIKRLRAMYANKIEIRVGVEFGYQPQSVIKINNFSKKIDFDFIICAVHEVDNQVFYLNEYGHDKSVKEAFTSYFEEYERCAKADIPFNVLAHFDLLKYYVTPECEKQVFKDNFDVIESTFKHLIATGKGIEVNTSGFDDGFGQPYPSIEFLKLYHSLGGEILTVGSDAHKPEHVSGNFDDTYALLKRIGFHYITRFENLKPDFVKL